MKKFMKRLVVALTVVAALIGTSIAFAGTMDQGVYIYDSTGTNHIYGVHAYMSTLSDMVITQGNPARDVELFAPTLLPFPNSCLELTVRTGRLIGMNYTAHELGVVDSCHSPAYWAVVWPMDANFKAKYERSDQYSGFYQGAYYTDKTIRVQVVQTNRASNCWSAQIWYWNNGAWDTIYSKCGTVVGRDGWYGWEIFETYGYAQSSSVNMCTALGSYGIAAMRQVQELDTPQLNHYVNVPAADIYSNISSTNPCFANGSWKYRRNTAGWPIGEYGDWLVCDSTKLAICN